MRCGTGWSRQGNNAARDSAAKAEWMASYETFWLEHYMFKGKISQRSVLPTAVLFNERLYLFLLLLSWFERMRNDKWWQVPNIWLEWENRYRCSKREEKIDTTCRKHSRRWFCCAKKKSRPLSIPKENAEVTQGLSCERMEDCNKGLLKFSSENLRAIFVFLSLPPSFLFFFFFLSFQNAHKRFEKGKNKSPHMINSSGHAPQNRYACLWYVFELLQNCNNCLFHVRHILWLQHNHFRPLWRGKFFFNIRKTFAPNYKGSPFLKERRGRWSYCGGVKFNHFRPTRIKITKDVMRSQSAIMIKKESLSFEEHSDGRNTLGWEKLQYLDVTTPLFPRGTKKTYPPKASVNSLSQECTSNRKR